MIKSLPAKLIMSLSVGSWITDCQAGIDNKQVRPNVIIILSDDQGWGDFSINGNKNLSTPNIDRLAKEGVSFTHFYVSPVCSPTRAELLTGRYHPRSGVFSTSEGGERMNLDETTIAEVFKKSGYATAAFGKWHNGMQYPYHPNARGFDEFYGFCSGHWGEYFSPMLEQNGQIVRGNGFITNDLTTRAIDFIANNVNKPFFLYIPYNTPHSPMQVPDRWWEKFRDRKPEMFATIPSSEDINFTRAALAMCENIDWNTGRILDKLQEMNLEKNTIVLYFCDNGPNSHRWNGGMKGIKGSTDEGGVRSPLFMRWPGIIPQGLKIDKIAAAIDLLPTLADLANIDNKFPNPLDGVSLKPLIKGNETTWKNRIIFSHWNGRISARDQQFRFNSDGKLFDMVADPGQKTDISVQLPDKALLFKELVKKWEKDVFENGSDKKRPFTVGHPDFRFTQLPARDGKAHGEIIRSSRFPNSSFFTNWTSVSDKITWDVEVMSAGNYQAEIYYTCPHGDEGSTIRLSFGGDDLIAKITEAHDPPLRGMETDRIARKESYVKDFKPLNAGIIHLKEGTGEMILRATSIPGKSVMDFRLLMLTRID